MDISKNQTDLDTVVTLAVIKFLIRHGDGIAWVEDFALSHQIELTQSETKHIGTAVSRTLDQLAMPFVSSLPDNLRSNYESILRKRSGYPEQIEEIDLP